VFLLGGEEDDITPWQQVHNMRHAVGSSQVRWYLAPGGHIGLFIGRQSQAEYWTPILAQVRELSRPAGITNATTSTATRVAGRASENRLLNGSGDLDEAEQTLRVRADTGDESAVSRLAELLAQHGDLGKLRTRADADDRDGATELAGLLEERADPDGALQILRAWANVGDWDARSSAGCCSAGTSPSAEQLAQLHPQLAKVAANSPGPRPHQRAGSPELTPRQGRIGCCLRGRRHTRARGLRLHP
jgi:hypothetical protein